MVNCLQSANQPTHLWGSPERSPATWAGVQVRPEAKINSKGGLIGIVALAVFLPGLAIRQHGRLSAAAQTESAEKAPNAELQNKVQSAEARINQLEAENQQLKVLL